MKSAGNEPPAESTKANFEFNTCWKCTPTFRNEAIPLVNQQTNKAMITCDRDFRQVQNNPNLTLFPLLISLRYHILFQTNMIFTTAWIACLLPAFAAAQYGNGDSGSSSTSPAPTASSTSAPAAAPSAPADTTGQKNVRFICVVINFHCLAHDA